MGKVDNVMRLNAPSKSDTVTGDMTPRPAFGKVFAAQRKRAGLTQEALVEAAGMPRAVTISDIENGRYYPSIPELQKLLRVMGISLSDFFAEWEGKKRHAEDSKATAEGGADRAVEVRSGHAATSSVTSPDTPSLDSSTVSPEEEPVVSPSSPFHRAVIDLISYLNEDEVFPLFEAVSEIARRKKLGLTPAREPKSAEGA